jgi:hypothetical protein
MPGKIIDFAGHFILKSLAGYSLAFLKGLHSFRLSFPRYSGKIDIEQCRRQVLPVNVKQQRSGNPSCEGFMHYKVKRKHIRHGKPFHRTFDKTGEIFPYGIGCQVFSI